MPTQIDENTPYRIWYSIYPLIFGLAYAQKAIFTENQNTKFISGLAMAHYGDIASDWMAHITDPFPLFSFILKWTYQVIGLHLGVHLSFLTLAGFYAMFSLWLAKTFVSNDMQKSRILWIFSFLWLLIHTEGPRQFWGHFFPDGLSYQYMLGEYYQPCCFGVFMLGGIAAYHSKRLILSAVCFIIAPLFHPTYIIASFLVPVGLILIPANRNLGITWKNRVIFVCLVLATLLPYTIWSANRLTCGNPEIMKKAHLILTTHRIPHHALPSHWSLRLTAQFFIVGFLAVWIGRKSFLGQILLILMSCAFLFTSLTLIWLNETFAALAPWRISVLAAPLSWVIIVAKFAEWISIKVENKNNLTLKRYKLTTFILVGAACLVGPVETFLNYRDKAERTDYLITKYIAGHHTHGNQYLVPPWLKNIRLEAGIPVFVTTKSHPTKDTEFLTWHDRVTIANQFFHHYKDHTCPELNTLLTSNSMTHIIWPAANGRFPVESLGHKIYSDRYFSLWDIRKPQETQLVSSRKRPLEKVH